MFYFKIDIGERKNLVSPLHFWAVAFIFQKDETIVQRYRLY